MRERTGQGSHIEVSMLEALGEWMGLPLYYTYGGKEPPPRTGASHATIFPYGPFPTGDGKTVMLGLQNEREWAIFCESCISPLLPRTNDLSRTSCGFVTVMLSPKLLLHPLPPAMLKRLPCNWTKPASPMRACAPWPKCGITLNCRHADAGQKLLRPPVRCLHCFRQHFPTVWSREWIPFPRLALTISVS
ncbi:hypothetical protein C032_02950 [Brucella abortus 63/294]|nr:hypothetical protein C032_02950 [Brucella abortus 63/294]ENS08434.1 hypothetical protein C980_02927 [Brucella abortus 88/217]ERU04895.1 hypothetical protein P039_02154 [Brucella abortus 07-0994-2411]ERU05213.1 hypothetical protein P039_01995 [Brucella abortus 07-0994-2411]